MKYILLAASALCAASWAQTTEDFEVGNTHAWSINGQMTAPHTATGGNPGGNISVLGFGNPAVRPT